MNIEYKEHLVTVGEMILINQIQMCPMRTDLVAELIVSRTNLTEEDVLAMPFADTGEIMTQIGRIIRDQYKVEVPDVFKKAMGEDA